MNYRHAYHAGNFADVLKHLVLVEILTYLKRKPTAFRVIDTHAGCGLYDLSGVEAGKTGEWEAGIGRLRGTELSPEVSELVTPYLEAVEAAMSGYQAAGGDAASAYPGSPLIAQALLRPKDRLIANELHPEDCANLRRVMARHKTTSKVMAIDGYVAMKSLLPPPERRGLVLVDPPFEVAGEFDRLATGLEEGLRRFSNGVFALWYPIKAVALVDAFKGRLAASGQPKILSVEIHLRTPADPDRLNGCGLVIANPPFLLVERLQRGLDGLVGVLSDEPGATGQITWITSETGTAGS